MAWPDSNTVRVAGYLLVGLLMLVARHRELRSVGATDGDGVWPTFWIATCAFVLAMAAGRAVEAGDLVASIGRSAADEGGWYESRRPIQAAVVGGVGASWFVIVTVALWRTPERRRRYLPVGLMVLTLAAFASVRIVSFHQVDSVLSRTDVGGVRVATVVELTLLALTGLATRWRPDTSRESGDRG